MFEFVVLADFVGGGWVLVPFDTGVPVFTVDFWLFTGAAVGLLALVVLVDIGIDRLKEDRGDPLVRAELGLAACGAEDR